MKNIIGKCFNNKKYIAGVGLILILLIVCGAYINSERDKNSILSLNITTEDEKTILNYLDKETDDIYPSKGEMFSAFKILGTEKDKLFIWMVKKAFFKTGDQEDLSEGGIVSLPVILKIKTTKQGIIVVSHIFPNDGMPIGNEFTINGTLITIPSYDEKENLEVDAKKRADQELNN